MCSSVLTHHKHSAQLRLAHQKPLQHRPCDGLWSFMASKNRFLISPNQASCPASRCSSHRALKSFPIEKKIMVPMSQAGYNNPTCAMHGGSVPCYSQTRCHREPIPSTEAFPHLSAASPARTRMVSKGRHTNTCGKEHQGLSRAPAIIPTARQARTRPWHRHPLSSR